MSAVILWPGKVFVSNIGNPDWILGQPDAQTITLNVSKYITIGNFQGGFYPDLLPLLNGSKGGDVVTAEMLARTHIIAFELNGGHTPLAGGWESSRWVFSDEVNTISVDWDERTGTGTLGAPASYPSEVVATGSIDSSNYASFFKIPAFESAIVSYILFELPPILDITSSNFTVRVSGWNDGQHGEGSPDPNAIGILACTS